MTYSQTQRTTANHPNASSSWPVESYPPWMESLMRDPRFLTHIILPQAVHAPHNRQSYWVQPIPSTRIHPTVRMHKDFGSASRRRQTLKKRSPMSRNPIPASYYPRQAVNHPRVSYQSAAPSPVHLLRRPANWRRGYQSPSKGGLGRYFSKLGSLIRNPSVRLPFQLNPLISYNLRRPNISYNLRTKPLPDWGLEFPSLGRPSNILDLSQLATSRPTHRLVVWHPNLPWYIKIEATHPNGITIQDVLSGIYQQLRRPIGQDEFYTVGLTSHDREMLSVSFHERCCGDVREIRKGVRRVDFLGREVCFVGLARSRKGVWELKTSVPDRPRMILVGDSHFMTLDGA